MTKEHKDMKKTWRHEELPKQSTLGNFLVNHIFKVPSSCQHFLPLSMYETLVEITLFNSAQKKSSTCSVDVPDKRQLTDYICHPASSLLVGNYKRSKNLFVIHSFCVCMSHSTNLNNTTSWCKCMDNGREHYTVQV